MKQSQSNNINLIEFNENSGKILGKKYSIKVDYNFDEVNKFLIVNYYFLGDYQQINFNDNLLFQNTLQNRQDNLWQHTCCELFIKNNLSNYYREFNFSFTGAWACCDFVDYRKVAEISKPNFNDFPVIKIIANKNNNKILNVKIPLAILLNADNFENMNLHFCAVVKELTNNNLYYYADKHLNNNKADFHKF